MTIGRRRGGEDRAAVEHDPKYDAKKQRRRQ